DPKTSNQGSDRLRAVGIPQCRPYDPFGAATYLQSGREGQRTSAPDTGTVDPDENQCYSIFTETRNLLVASRHCFLDSRTGHLLREGCGTNRVAMLSDRASLHQPDRRIFPVI